MYYCKCIILFTQLFLNDILLLHKHKPVSGGCFIANLIHIVFEMDKHHSMLCLILSECYLTCQGSQWLVMPVINSDLFM